MTDKIATIHDFETRTAGENEEMIFAGDAVLIIRPSGEIVPMSINIDQALVEGAQTKRHEDWTDAERTVMMQGQTMFLLSMASQSPVIMNILAEIANAPGVLDLDKIKKVVTLH